MPEIISDWVQVRDWFMITSAALSVTALWAIAWGGR